MLPPNSFPLKAYITTGFDGSGSHHEAQQKSRIGVDQSHREAAYVTLRQIKTRQGTPLYSNPHVSSVHGVRPWMIIPQKENRGTIKTMMDSFMNREMKEVTENELVVKLSEEVSVTVEAEVKPFLVDKKAVKETTGMGGAACTSCPASRDEIHNPDCVREGFPMNRSMSSVIEIAAQLTDEATGEIMRLD